MCAVLESRKSQVGFTLVEVLVALVITSLLISILMGLLYYVYRVQDALRGEIVEREFDLRIRDWFGETIGACVPADSNSGNHFTGTATEISCDSLAPLRPQAPPSPQRITLLVRRNTNDKNELAYAEQGNGTGTPTPLLILPDGEAKFIFYDISGDEKDKWPITKNHPETLPRRIRLVVTHASSTVFDWLATPRADPWLEPMVKNPFGFELPR